MVKGAGDKIINEPISLPTPGKADVVVTILSSRSDEYEICFVEHAAFYDLATPVSLGGPPYSMQRHYRLGHRLHRRHHQPHQRI